MRGVSIGEPADESAPRPVFRIPNARGLKKYVNGPVFLLRL